MISERPVVAVDFDDIVAGYNKAYHQWHNKHYGTTFTYDELVTFDMCALYGIDISTLGKRVDRFVEEHHDEILPIEGAKEGLQLLSSACDLQVVTSRCESLRGVTTGWIKTVGLEYFSHYHFTNGFNSIYPERKRKKVEVCAEIGAVALIDDADGNALEAAHSGLRVFMLARPWNGSATHKLITRLQSWEEIVPEVLHFVHADA